MSAYRAAPTRRGRGITHFCTDGGRVAVGLMDVRIDEPAQIGRVLRAMGVHQHISIRRVGIVPYVQAIGTRKSGMHAVLGEVTQDLRPALSRTNLVSHTDREGRGGGELDNDSLGRHSGLGDRSLDRRASLGIRNTDTKLVISFV